MTFKINHINMEGSNKVLCDSQVVYKVFINMYFSQIVPGGCLKVRVPFWAPLGSGLTEPVPTHPPPRSRCQTLEFELNCLCSCLVESSKGDRSPRFI